MKKAFMFLPLMAVWAASALAQGSGAPSSSQSIRPIGVVTKLQAGSFTLHTDAGSDLLVVLGDGTLFLRVPPGAMNLNAAAKISIGDISSGDRVLVRGNISEDQKSVVATSVIVMTKSDLASAREAERLDWQRRGIGGTVESVSAETKELTVLVPTAPSAAGNTTHAVSIALKSDAVLLRYAPDSVKFSDAKPSSFEQIKVGDQIRALGTKSEDGGRFTAEKLVSGTFRSLGVTVISIDTESRTINLKDLPTEQSILVPTNKDSQLHRLPSSVARALATVNSRGMTQRKSGSEAGGAR